MKRLVFALAISALALLAAPQAKSADVSIDFFYNNLSGGSWLEIDPYGYCWQPDVEVNDPTWRPYSDGYWAYTDDGWTWVSYEDFGWATYHYGRWTKLTDYGWVWVPGDEWAPAWVSWRFGGNYCGWAPLPPETETVYESQPLTGHLDVEFDIGPAYYNFVDLRYIGEPVLRSRLVPVSENVTYINQTVNVTNITYQNNTVYNYGPDINVVNQYSSRPIQRLKLERQQNVDLSAAAKTGGMSKVQGNALVVAAPQKLTKPANPAAPPTVKAKVTQPKFEHGWSVAGDANAQNQLKEKIKTQDLKKVPPPTTAGAAAGASPVTTAAPATAASPVGRGTYKGKAAERFQSGAAASPAGAMASPATSPAIPERGKPGGRAGQQIQPGAAASPRVQTSPGVAPERERAGRGRHGEELAPTPATAPTAGTEGVTAPEGRRRGFERSNIGPTPAGAGSASENLNETRGRYRHGEQPGMSPTSPQGGPPAAQSGAAGEARSKHRAEGAGAPPTGTSPTGAARETKHEGRGKAEKGSPAPTP
jgi:hypothetical protein